MAERFDKFTERAQRVLSLAHGEAQRFNHNYIGTEHLLLGLTLEREGVAAKVLANLGIEVGKVRTTTEFIIGRGAEQPEGELGLTARAKRVIELAIEEARRLNHNYIGTEHLLLGLVREGEGIAAGVLESLSVNLDRVREETTQVLAASESRVAADRGRAPPKQSAGTPTLDRLGIDLTTAVRAGEIDPVIGRDSEIERVVQILSRRTKNNPVLIGEPGVGKTAVAEGLAQRIVAGTAPDTVLGKRLVTLDLASLVAGTKWRGEFERRLKSVIKELQTAKSCILFIDELHMLVGAGAAEGSVDAANILKPVLARGEIQIIGATTLDEYRRYIERDAALERRFQPVRVEEPSTDETIEILKGVRGVYEQHHRLKIDDDALKAATELSARYVPDRFLPDKAIDLIDEAGARVRIRTDSRAAAADGAEANAPTPVAALRREQEQAHASGDEARAAELVEREKRLEQLRLLGKIEAAARTLEDGDGNEPRVSEEDIRDVLSMWTGIPLTRIASEETARLIEMEQFLRDRVIGQDEAISAVAKAVRRARAGLKNPKRPIGVFMFLGPTGVGKTYLAETLAEFMFGSKDNIVRLDMSEFMEKHTVSRLVGSPPGYVGYDDGGQLTDLVRRRSYCLILLDEIEKAHPDVYNMLLQIFNDGHLSDAKGRKVDFRNTIIIQTSNVGSDLIRKDSRFGFNTASDDAKTAEQMYERMKDKVTEEMKRVFRPEFLNRIDQSVVFHALAEEHIRQIVDLELKDVRDNLREKDITLEVEKALLDHLGKKGFDPVFGARPLRRVIQNEVEDRLSDALLDGQFSEGDAIRLDYIDGEVTAEKIASAPLPEPPVAAEQERAASAALRDAP